MKKRKRRGISFGTIFMLGLTLLVVVGAASVFPKLAGDATLGISSQTIVTAISSAVDLPQLSLADIPINNPSTKPTATTTVAPGGGEGIIVITTQKPGESTQGVAATAPPATPNIQVTTSTPAPTAVPKKAVITLAGTAAFQKGIRQSAYNDESKTYDFRHLLSNIQDEIKGDIAIATLENTIVVDKELNDVNTTPAALTALKNGGISLLSIGNEHILDYGLPGLEATEAQVRKAGFSVVGTTLGAQQNLLLDAGNMKVGVLHFIENLSSAGQKQLKKQEVQGAIPVYDSGTIAQQVTQLRGEGADVVIVMLHWGKDNQKEVTAQQQEIAAQVASAGADILLGSHTERVFPITYTQAVGSDGKQRQMLTIYSLGALLTQERGDHNCGGLLLNVQMSFDEAAGVAKVDQVTYTPTYIWRYKEDGDFVYRVVASDQPPPEGMDESQAKVKEKILGVVQNSLGNSPVTLRNKE